jgi:hypothetical protein
MKTHLETQVSGTAARFQMVITLTTGESYWTSRPARLQAETREQALAEASGQVRQLRKTLNLDGQS